MSYSERLQTKITRRTFVVDGIKEGWHQQGSVAKHLKDDFNHVPDTARLVEVSFNEEVGVYTFKFEYDELEADHDN